MSKLAGRYELERRLGGGGMAEVFLARLVGKDGFSRPVAIKRVLAHLATDEAFAKMFVAEAQMCAKLQHPNIVSVLDFDRDDEGRPFLVIELVDGPNLAELADGGALPIGAVVHLATELLRGLAYAHDLPSGDDVRGIVHRDISPHNVLLSWEGAVKLSDFGIAKARAASGVTASELLKGKPAYMSPEQANGEALDGRSDLFSVGIVLWELLVGRTLFSGHTTQETLARVLFAPIPSPRSVRAEIPDDVDAVVMKLLARERDDRYADANDAIAALIACKGHPRDGREQLVALLADRFAANAPQRNRMLAEVPTVRTPAEYAPTLPSPRDAARPRARPWAFVLGAITLTSIAVAVTVLALGRREAAKSTLPSPADAPAIDTVLTGADDAPPEQPPVDASPIDAVSDRASERAKIAQMMAASPNDRAPFSFPYARLFDPRVFHTAAQREAQRLFGTVTPGTIIWKQIDSKGSIDSTRGGSARDVFIAKPQADGYRCVEVGVEKGAGFVRLASDATCDEAGAPPACTSKQLYDRAGLPAGELLSASMGRLRRWQLTSGSVSTHSANDCSLGKSPSEADLAVERAKIVAAGRGRGDVPFPPPDETAVDPTAYFASASAEVRRLFGKVGMVISVDWSGIGRDGRLDGTKSSRGITIVFRVEPMEDGFHCVQFTSNYSNDGGRFRMMLVKSEAFCKGLGSGATSVPRCTSSELYQRATQRGLPATSKLRARLESDNWVLHEEGATFSATTPNDCH